MQQVNKNLNKIIFLLFVINIIVIYILKPSCPWKTNFNIECAGCGATRMVEAILKLDFYQAYRFNPLLFCLLIIFIIYGFYILICKIIKKNYYKIGEREWLILLILVILFMILRNIPYFEYLKPTKIR